LEGTIVQSVDQPVAPVLSHTKTAAKLAGVSVGQARPFHRSFLEELHDHNRTLWDAYLKEESTQKQRPQSLKNLPFLELRRDTLDPTLGLFKTLHLLECVIATVRRCPKKTLPKYKERLIALMDLALHFQKRRGGENPALASFIRELADEIILGRTSADRKKRGSEATQKPADEHRPSRGEAEPVQV
jgi:hypothetical protein